MGHLSTSECVTTQLTTTSTKINNDTTPPSTPTTKLIKRLMNGNAAATSSSTTTDDCDGGNVLKKSSSSSNGFVNFHHNNTNNNNNNNNHVNNDDNCVKDDPKSYPNHIDLDEYTRNFKGDNVLGIQFLAPLKWDKVIQITLLHLTFIVCLLLYPLEKLKLLTVIWSFFTGGVAGFGVTAGAHRFWTHRSYKANLPLRIILMACFSLAGQNTLYDWVRDHRVHHKYSETDADPHNSNRGFFFAHVGWLMMLKHPEVLRKGRKIDMSDVLSDPVIQFHQKYFIPLKLMLCFVLPTMVPMYFWNEEWHLAFMTQCIFRYVSSLNFTWSVNSAAHMWGTRPYDKRIQPSENIYVSILAMGEGWHNYHHVFPWDYKAAELGNHFNFTTRVLDLFHKMGWAWDMKQPSNELVRRTLEKYGDGTHELANKTQNNNSSHGGHCHYPEVPDPEDDAESSSTESSKLDENDNNLKKKTIA